MNHRRCKALTILLMLFGTATAWLGADEAPRSARQLLREVTQAEEDINDVENELKNIGKPQEGIVLLGVPMVGVEGAGIPKPGENVMFEGAAATTWSDLAEAGGDHLLALCADFNRGKLEYSDEDWSTIWGGGRGAEAGRQNLRKLCSGLPKPPSTPPSNP